ncbi:TonB-dependent receptor plug domain-containing protein [Nonlabens marinus]|uniref:Putative ferric aerobactin receptor n=1 Tax=Nonlabens marinus S1-08 TaxID=1454201 RepID=W8W029_9FLAO|nr:carboxypeptidase-like regulatory domain-containing protein [Nonlabens marinus]BAO55606.1 putative ferric aerobactin receptor [Nonlabens marinus S1-08]
MRSILFLLSFICSAASYAQQATIQGIILNEQQQPVGNVNVTVVGTTLGTISNSNGYYELKVPVNSFLELQFSNLTYQPVRIKNLILKSIEVLEINPVLKINVEQIATVTINTTSNRDFEGVTVIDPELIRKIPGAQPGVENILMSLPGVNNNNELSTQYAVRGGNYDENLVYINEIEVYRPFLIRSGQQEGLSVVNTDLVRSVDFSAGGFQAKYGDKLSSVLDIEYRRPTDFGAGIDASLLGASAFVEGTAFAKAMTATAGLRYRDNSLFINSRETQANAVPRFYDAQTYITYRISPKFELAFLGNIAVNSYDFEPEDRQTNFGTIQEPIAVVIDYEGQEEDQYETYFGAIKASYDVNDQLNLRFIASTYLTQEQEHYDILARYGIGSPNTNIGSRDFGQVDFVTGIGSELEHGRNDLDALIATAEHRGTYVFKNEGNSNDQLDWGLKYNVEDIRDRVREYTVVDSAGFSVRPPNSGFRNDEPYNSFTAPLTPFNSINANNEVQIQRVQAYVQYNSRGFWGENEVFWNLGGRIHNWTVYGDAFENSTQTVISPRGQFAIKPYWKNTDMLFRLSTGVYYQPPFYRELRDENGTVVPDVKAQRSLHFVVGNDWSFSWNDRPFKLTSEAYYKNLSDVNTYTLENVRIRYRANNEAKAYAYGLDLRLNGEFIKGTESWISAGYLKTEENLNDRGFISRPTDQRLKFAMLFQDYVPNMPQLRMYLNLVYNTGLPGGSPNYADPYDFQFRLRDYRRADLGINYVFKDDENESKTFANFDEFYIGAEIYNIFDNQNSITNIWVRDIAANRQIAIPNFLTPRVLNFRVVARF